MFQTNNPALRNEAFAPAQTWDSAMGGVQKIGASERSTTMTVSGTAWKSLGLLTICAVVAAIGWRMITNNGALMLPFFGVGIVGALIFGLIISFKPKTAPVLAPVYAIFEGAVVAGASVMWTAYASKASSLSTLGTGLVLQAGVLTIGIAGAMFIAYGTRLIKPTRWMLSGIAAITGGVIFFSFVMFMVSFFFPGQVQGFWQSPIGLGVAGLIVVVAAFNLISDFALIENGAQNKAPKYMEWYGGFALLVTLVWLYISLLRLLALLKRE